MSSPRIIAKAPGIQIASTRITRSLQLVLLATVAVLALLRASELPRLPSDLDPRAQTYAAQQKLPYLDEPYVSNAPEDLGDGLPVIVPSPILVDCMTVMLLDSCYAFLLPP